MKTKNSLLLTVTISLSVLLLGACLRTNPEALQGTAWLLTEMNGTLPINGTTLTIELGEEQISGSAGCNHFGGKYTINGDKIQFETIFNTEMACVDPEGVMEQEQAYLNYLRRINHFTFHESELTLITTDNQQLTYTPYVPTVPINPTRDTGDGVYIEATGDVQDTASTSYISPAYDFNVYQGPETGISILIPESCILTGIVEGEQAILQSYPEGKYVGGEAREERDTKCHLNIQPNGISSDELIEQWKSSPVTTIQSEKPFSLNSGQIGTRFEIESLGQSISVVIELGGRFAVLT